MRFTVIKDDNAAIKDGVHRTVDCSDLPADFHALQWDGTSGEIEYRTTVCEHCNARSKKPNAVISEIPANFRKHWDAWHVEDERVKAAEAERAKAKEETRAKIAEAAAKGPIDVAGHQD